MCTLMLEPRSHEPNQPTRTGNNGGNREEEGEEEEGVLCEECAVGDMGVIEGGVVA